MLASVVLLSPMVLRVVIGPNCCKPVYLVESGFEDEIQVRLLFGYWMLWFIKRWVGYMSVGIEVMLYR